jgi:hypothetical protein
MACQIIPLPPALRLILAPRAGGVDSALWLDAPPDPFAGPDGCRLTLADALALILAVTVVLFFWAARTLTRWHPCGGARHRLTGWRSRWWRSPSTRPSRRSSTGAGRRTSADRSGLLEPERFLDVADRGHTVTAGTWWRESSRRIGSVAASTS